MKLKLNVHTKCNYWRRHGFVHETDFVCIGLWLIIMIRSKTNNSWVNIPYGMEQSKITYLIIYLLSYGVFMYIKKFAEVGLWENL